MFDLRRFALTASLLFASLSSFACGPSSSGQSDGGARYPDARVSDAGRVRHRDATTGDVDEDDSGVAGDSGNPNDTGVGFHYNWYEHIQPIIEARCSGAGLCHTDPPQFGAPRSFVHYSDVTTTNVFGQKVHEVMAYRIIASSGHMPPATNTQLTATEIERILSWSADRAPAGPEPADSGIPGDAAPVDGGIPLPWADGGMSPNPGPGLRYVEIHAHAENDLNQPYTAERGLDGTSYICFGFTVPPNPNPNAMPESAVEFDAFLDGYRNVHHLFAFQIEPQNTVADGPDNCILGGGGRIIGSWFPGRGNTILPTGTGVPIIPGQRFNLQVHYDSVPNQGVPDMSGLRILLTEQQGLIPAGEVWAGIDWTDRLMGPGDVTLQSVATNMYDDIHLFTVTPHMHQRGLRMSLEYRRATDPMNQWTMLNNTDPWDFTNQVLLEIDPTLVLNTGDQLRTTCTWSTATGAIAQGQSSQNEMCYFYLYHYRAVGSIPPLLPFYYFVGFPQ